MYIRLSKEIFYRTNTTVIVAIDNITTESGTCKKKNTYAGFFYLTKWNVIFAAKVPSNAEPSTTWIILLGYIIMIIKNQTLATFLTESYIFYWFQAWLRYKRYFTFLTESFPCEHRDPNIAFPIYFSSLGPLLLQCKYYYEASTVWLDYGVIQI